MHIKHIAINTHSEQIVSTNCKYSTVVQLHNVLCSQLNRAWSQYGGRVLLWWSVPDRKWGELFSRGCEGW